MYYKITKHLFMKLVQARAARHILMLEVIKMKLVNSVSDLILSGRGTTTSKKMLENMETT